jgi:hypothetical protein
VASCQPGTDNFHSSGTSVLVTSGFVHTARPPGPGNQINAPINIINPIGQDHLTNMVNTANQAQVPRVRQGVRPLPG